MIQKNFQSTIHLKNLLMYDLKNLRRSWSYRFWILSVSVLSVLDAFRFLDPFLSVLEIFRFFVTIRLRLVFETLENRTHGIQLERLLHMPAFDAHTSWYKQSNKHLCYNIGAVYVKDTTKNYSKEIAQAMTKKIHFWNYSVMLFRLSTLVLVYYYHILLV